MSFRSPGTRLYKLNKVLKCCTTGRTFLFFETSFAISYDIEKRVENTVLWAY